MASVEDVLKHLYDRFNARDMEAVLAMMRDEVVWTNGMDGGHVRDGVRDYRTRQGAMIDPHVEPIGFSAGPDGAAEVEVRQTVRDRAGRALSERIVRHVFRFADGLIERFDIG